MPSTMNLNHGSIPVDERVDTHRLAERLGGALRSVRAKTVDVDAGAPGGGGGRVRFTAGMFRIISRWNVLAPIADGELVVDPDAGRVGYRVSFRQLVWLAAGVSAGFAGFIAAFLLLVPGERTALTLGIAAGWLAGLWTLTGVNALIARARFERFLRKTLDAAAAGERADGVARVPVAPIS